MTKHFVSECRQIAPGKIHASILAAAEYPVDMSSGSPLFTVRQTVPLRGDGLLLAPGLPHGIALERGEALRLRRPDGSALVVVTGGKSIPPHRESHHGTRTYPVQIRSAVIPEDVPTGTEVWRMDQ